MKKKIVIVDDMQLQRELMSKILTKEGFEIVGLSSGEECMTYFRENTADIILLDIMMAGVSGIGVLKNLRQKFSSIELPIIMVTSKDSEDDIIGAFDEGANDYISKPANWSVALARINTQLALSDFHKESLRLKELEALNAMIVTYNHEINGNLSIISHDISEALKKDEKFQRTEKAVKKITSILKKIDQVTESDVEYEKYTTNHNMISLKKAK